MMTIKENLKEAITKLQQNEVLEPQLKARTVLAFILKKNKEYLVINEEYKLIPGEQESFKQAIMRLIQGEPLQHITKKQEFMGLEFTVNENVLIPRPDTEVLVEEVIDILNNIGAYGIRSAPKPVVYHTPLQVLDLCTGSGAIAIAIAKRVENVQVLGADISQEALEVAKQNVGERVKLIQSDLFENIEEKFDLIVSNPPYIEKAEIKNLDTEVRKEPLLALDGGEDRIRLLQKNNM